MSVETSAPRSRRAVLAAALGGLGAVVASRLGSPPAVSAVDGDAVTVGGTFFGATATALTNAAVGSRTATAFVGAAPDGTGLRGWSSSIVPSDFGTTSNRTGVYGISGDASLSIPATSTDETGVYGFANVSGNSVGVWGDTPDGYGLYGTGYFGVYGIGQVAVVGDTGASGTGVYGFAGLGDPSAPTAGVAVEATAGSIAELALKVNGRVRFSRSGRARVLAGRSSRKVTMAGVTTSSYVIATLQTHRAGVFVSAVVPAAGYFTIYLNRTVSALTYIGYLVIN